jgi:hypothetical protein
MRGIDPRRSTHARNDPADYPGIAGPGALPAWPYSRGWGYYPSGGLTLVLLIVILVLLIGRA